MQRYQYTRAQTYQQRNQVPLLQQSPYTGYSNSRAGKAKKKRRISPNRRYVALIEEEDHENRQKLFRRLSKSNSKMEATKNIYDGHGR